CLLLRVTSPPSSPLFPYTTLFRSQPDQLIAMVSLADGADAAIWLATETRPSREPSAPVVRQIARGGKGSYSAFLTWRGFLDRERSEEHTSELQSLTNLLCPLLLVT